MRFRAEHEDSSKGMQMNDPSVTDNPTSRYIGHQLLAGLIALLAVLVVLVDHGTFSLVLAGVLVVCGFALSVWTVRRAANVRREERRLDR